MAETLTNTTSISRSDITMALNRRPRKMRARRVAKDRFGRVYVYFEDLNAEAPVGLIDRLFHAPVAIPDKYLKFDADRPWRIDYDFVGWVRDTMEEERQWDERVKETMVRLYKEKGAEAMAPGGSGPTQAALEIVGSRPVPSLLIRALANGDPWCLGFSAERTPLVEQIIGKETKAERQLRKPRRTVEPQLQLPAELQSLLGKAAVPSRFEDEADDDETEARLAALNRAAEVEAREDEPDELDEETDVLTGDEELDEEETDLDQLFEEADEEEEPEPRKPRSGKGAKNPRMKQEAD